MTRPRMPRRAAVVLLLLALVLTLAPRTSEPLAGGWRAFIFGDTFESARGTTRTLTFAAVPPAAGTGTVLSVIITGAPLTLEAASDECEAVAGKVVCVLEPEAMRRNHVLRIRVQTTAGQALHWTMTTPATG